MYEEKIPDNAKIVIKWIAEEARSAMKSRFAVNDQIPKADLLQIIKDAKEAVKYSLDGEMDKIDPKYLGCTFPIRYLEEWKEITNMGNSYKRLR